MVSYDSVLRVHNPIFFSKAQWLSWLERRPVTAEVVGSSPIWVVIFLYRASLSGKQADVAQLAEQLICNQQVIGSSPIIGFLFFYNLYRGVEQSGSSSGS